MPSVTVVDLVGGGPGSPPAVGALTDGLAAAGLEVAAHRPDAGAHQGEADAVVVCLDAVAIGVLDDPGTSLPAGRVNVGWWCGADDAGPATPATWPRAVGRLDEVWVPAPGLAEVVPAAVGVPVVVVGPEELAGRIGALVARHAGRSPRRAVVPPVQVVVHAAEPWPALAGTLDALMGQVGAAGGELLVGAADASVLPEEHRPAGARVVTVGSRSPFALRRAALLLADAELVVVTEDHCRPEPGWLAGYLDGPDAPVLAGPVANGSGETDADWANYLMGFGAWAPPLDRLPAGRCPTVANVAVRREVLRGLADEAPGWFERAALSERWRNGEVAVVPDAGVAHDQPFPGWRHMVNHLADGRTAGAAGGGGGPSFSPAALLATARGFLRGVSAAVADRPELHRHHRAAAGWLRALAAVKAIGLAWGARCGPGRAGEWLD